MGEGCLGEGEVTIPKGMRSGTSKLDDLVDDVFPSIAERFSDAKWVGKRAILSPSNKEVQEVNEAVLDRLPGREVVMKSIDTTEEGGADYPPEFLNTCELSGMPPNILKLKVGTSSSFYATSTRRRATATAPSTSLSTSSRTCSS